MSRFALLLAALSIAITPANCAPADQSPAHHAASARAHARKKPICRAHTSVAQVNDQEPMQPVALTGQLIYEELGLPPPPSLEELQIQSEAQANAEKVIDAPKLQALEPKYDSTVENSSASALGCWSAWLKMLVFDLLLGRSGDRSWVSEVNAGQSSRLAEEIAAYLATQAPPQSTTILLAPPPSVQANNPFTVALTDALRKAGFGLVDSKRQAANAEVVRYQVSSLNGGVLVQLEFQQKLTNQYYGLGASNNLVAGAPLCVREVR